MVKERWALLEKRKKRSDVRIGSRTRGAISLSRTAPFVGGKHQRTLSRASHGPFTFDFVARDRVQRAHGRGQRRTRALRERGCVGSGPCHRIRASGTKGFKCPVLVKAMTSSRIPAADPRGDVAHVEQQRRYRAARFPRKRGNGEIKRKKDRGASARAICARITRA